MKLENEFTVPAPVDQAWEVLLDVERVAPCLPGAAIEGSEGDSHKGTMTIKVGPITTRYTGTVKIEEADEAAHRAVMRAQARDSRGQGTAGATITSTMEAVDGGTRVHVETDLRVTGPAAQFGRGVMQDVSAKMMRQFAECLASEMSGTKADDGAAEEPAAPETPAEEPLVPPHQHRAEAETEETKAIGEKPGAEAKARPRPTPEVLDLADASREAVLKRAVPVVGGMVVLYILLRLIRRS